MHTETATWPEAARACTDMNGQLFKVKSRQIGHQLLNDFRYYKVWTGAKEYGHTFFWLDGNVQQAYRRFL